MTDKRIPTREEKLAPIIGRALSDAAFCKRLVESPKAVIAEELGVELPDELKIEVLQESSEKLYVVVPPLPAQGELNDEQLKAIAGGQITAWRPLNKKILGNYEHISDPQPRSSGW